MPKPFEPQILTANDLVEGDSVFLSETGWVREIAAARVAATPEEAELLATDGRLAEAENKVVGAYLVAVRLEGGAPVPLARRERIRAEGRPSFDYRAAPARISRAA